MTKALYPAPAQLVLTCRISSTVRGRVFTTVDIGTNSHRFISRVINDRSFVLNAKYNAIYSHMHKGGSSNANVQIIDFDIKYFDHFVTRSRVLRKDGRTGKKEYWSEVRDKQNNKLIGRIKWKTHETL